MKGLKKLLLAFAFVGLTTSGCASLSPEAQQDLADLRAFTVADVDAAIARAAKAADPGAPFRARCYVTLKKYVEAVGTDASLQAPAGLVDGFELLAEVDAKLQGGGPLVPPDLEADCAYIGKRLRMFALRNGAKLAPMPGVGAVGGFLGR